VHSNAEIDAWMLPVHSIARSTPPLVISAMTLVQNKELLVLLDLIKLLCIENKEYLKAE